MKCSQIQRGRRWGRGRIHVHNTRTDRQTDGKLDTHKPTQADAQADKAECALTDNHALRSHQFMFLSSLPHLPSLHFSLLSLICTSSSLTLHHLTYLLLLFTTPFLILPYHSLPSITSLTPQSCQEIFLWLPSVSSTATRQIATGHFETPSRRLCNQPGTGHDSRCACSPPGK